MSGCDQQADLSGRSPSPVEGPSGARVQSRLRTVPITLAEANAFVDQYHRHHRGNAKHRISTSVIDEDGTLRGVAIMARPKAKAIDQYAVAEVVRLATDGCPNACSALYGACCRIGRVCGFAHVITYTLLSEPGTSLRAAGWKPTAITDGGSWDRPSRPRVDEQHPLERKVRWECRCSSASAIDLEAAA